MNSSYFILFFVVLLILYYFCKHEINEHYENYTKHNNDFFLNPSLILSSDHEKVDMMRYLCKLPCK